MWLRRTAESFRLSVHELKRVRSLVTAGLLMALQVILGMLTIQIGQSIQITFDYLPLCLTGMLFGPVPAMISGALADLIAFLFRPTGAFNPGFTISAAVSGLIYGLVFYKREPVRLWQLLLGRLLTILVCNVCLNSLWLILMYGPGAWAWIPGRILKNIVEYPVSIVLLLGVQKALSRIRKPSSGS